MPNNLKPEQSKERKQILKAIQDLKLKATPSDVATKTGLPILKVTQELNQIATDTSAHLQVSETGDIAYHFAGNIQAAYMAKGIRRVFERVWGKTLAALFFLVRISFGIMLIVSLIIISVLIIFLIIVMSQRGSNDRHGGFGGFGGGFHFGFFDYLILRDLIWWGTASSYRHQYRLDEPPVRRPDQGKFRFNVFSFLFGDGNPNKNLEERKWAMIARVIRNARGVVTAEQLAPYTGAEPGDEDAVLPVLTRFDGKPEVSDTGNIIYTFPSLTSTVQTMEELRELPPYLKEWHWKFSNVPDGGLTPVFIMSGLNLFGSLFLLNFATSTVYDELGRMAINPLEPFAPLLVVLLTYGALFLAVPAVRYVIQGKLNDRIDQRNARRMRNAELLTNPSDELLVKLRESKEYKMDMRLLTEANTIYDTRKDDMDQNYKDDLEKKFDASP